ncbi:hypothetical protein D5086_031979 [Populus alba]|uniref:Uncharacterized protein n=1 Tax=Populus alba TaxID=43335 RepID=A0ACC4AK31_POPAL
MSSSNYLHLPSRSNRRKGHGKNGFRRSVGAEAAPSSSFCWNLIACLIREEICCVQGILWFSSRKDWEGCFCIRFVQNSPSKVENPLLPQSVTFYAKICSFKLSLMNAVGFSSAIIWPARSKPGDVLRHPSEDLGVLAPRVEGIA